MNLSAFSSRGGTRRRLCHCRIITAANISVRRKKKQKINPQDKSAYGIAPGRYKPKLFVYLESKNHYKLCYRNISSIW